MKRKFDLTDFLIFAITDGKSKEGKAKFMEWLVDIRRRQRENEIKQDEKA